MRSSTIALLRRVRVPVLIIVDSAAWMVAMFLAVAARLTEWRVLPELRHSDASPAIPLYGVLAAAALAAVLHVLACLALRLYQGRSITGSFEEAFMLFSALFATGVVITVANAMFVPPILPRTTPLVAACFAALLCAWPRAFWRVAVNEPRMKRNRVVTTPVLIVGAGEAACRLVESMERDPKQRWSPVGFIDDDRRKKHFRHRGVRVVGTVDELTRLAVRRGVDTVVYAIPSGTSDLLARVNRQASEAHLSVKVLPQVSELMHGVRHQQIRDLEPADLLGRHQIDIDVSAVAEYLTGRRVLVTGAGGSIGSELCRQIQSFEPAQLIMLDRDESALHSLALSLSGRADLEAPHVVLADIRDTDRLFEAFETHRPDVVFHAAALKHVNVLERHACEAWKTNVLGTRNVLEAATASGVARFVNISSDKAADPQSVLGYSKRVAEGLTAAYADVALGTYLSVRFGNVLGTRGSVLTTFESQIKRGVPVTVTHPDVTRYFMTIDEAVQLVIQAAAIGRDGEALVLDMGEPVRIFEVAQQMIEHFDSDVPIVVTGLKPGEKLHESLFGTGEPDRRPMHPLVSHVDVPTVHVTDTALDAERASAAMRRACALMAAGVMEGAMR
jgi:FlaA1/EpsC-like NDP-sugar epimerase